MSHRNPKLQISESALSSASSQVLASGHGTALCPGALPDAWTSAPYRLATPAHSGSLVTSHTPSSLTAAPEPRDQVSPSTPSLESIIPALYEAATSLYGLPRGVQTPELGTQAPVPGLVFPGLRAGVPGGHAHCLGSLQKGWVFYLGSERSSGETTVSLQTTFWNHYMQDRPGQGREGRGGEGRDPTFQKTFLGAGNLRR